MNKIVTLITAIFFTTNCFCQLDSAVLKRIATGIELNFEHLDNDEFGPLRLQDATMYTLLPDFNEESIALRKLLLQGKFKTTKDLFAWLLPIVDRMAIKTYLNSGKEIDAKYVGLYSKVTVATCACFETFKKAGLENAFKDSASLKCLKGIWADTALMQTYRSELLALEDNEKVKFLTGLLRYSQVNCDNYFNQLVELSVNNLPVFYDKAWQSLKVRTFFKALRYNAAGITDSLQLIFPAYKQFLPQLQQLAAIQKKCPNPELPTQPLTEQPGFDRYATFITQYTNGKPHIFAQVVFEIGTDRPMPYVKKITVYGRESLQNIDRLEQSLPPLPKN